MTATTDTDDIDTAIAYRLNGANFRMSAEQLSNTLELDAEGRANKLTAIPFFFLASHAAELFLKSALLKRGLTSASLKKYDYRHNLAGLLQELRSKGVSVSSETCAVVLGLSEQHRTHQLRYTVLLDDGNKTYWPPLSLVFAALDDLLLATRLLPIEG